jgi:hypothetical protein
MKQGDFSAAGLPAIYDPASTRSDGKGGFIRDQFSCGGRLNVICADRINSSSKFFTTLLPDPNLPGLANNYKGVTSSSNDMDQGLIKIDQNIGKARFSASYNHTRQPTISQGPFGSTLSGTFGINQGRRVILNFDQTLAANKLNHFGASFNRWAFFNHQGDQQDLSNG